MRLAHFCIDRPIFAAVISILITMLGAASFFSLPLSQYPEIVPPTVVIRANYPGASAQVVSDTVATPIEQQINGVEDMLYMSSQATGDGQLTTTITFQLGTDLDKAQVLVQNRLSLALPRLPESVSRQGLTVRKSSPDLLLAVHMRSPDNSRDQLYISNYVNLTIRDVLARIEGVGDVRMLGAQDLSMVVWLDPDKAAARNLTAGEIVAALRSQNVQISAGVVNQPPTATSRAYQLNVEALGRLTQPEQFANIVIKSEDGRVTRVRDVARVEVASQTVTDRTYINESPGVGIGVFQLPGGNALATADEVRATMTELAKNFPSGVEYQINFDPTRFVSASVYAVYTTIIEAVILVALVVILFLQRWRAAIVPIAAIPVSLVGTFAALAAFGYSLNTISLLGLVLAIGIVVDDAIIVVENVERNLEKGMTPKEAAHVTMDEVGVALIAIGLILMAVFAPAAFLPGIPGRFFEQFAITISVATLISVFVSLTLSPALCAVLLKPHTHGTQARPRFWGTRALHWFFGWFNRGFDWMSERYGRLTARLLRISTLALVVYVGFVGLAGWQLMRAPTGFIPEQDQSQLVTIVKLPPGSSLERTDATVVQIAERLKAIEGVQVAVSSSGIDGATGVNASNVGRVFTILKPHNERGQGLDLRTMQARVNAALAGIQDAQIVTVLPPSVRGIGSTGGFKLMVTSQMGASAEEIAKVANDVVAAANREPSLSRVFTPFDTGTPKIFADIDRVKSEMIGVPADRVFEALEVYLGSAYVNDFNLLGRTYRVAAQADSSFRQDVEAIGRYRTRSDSGEMVPLSSVASFSEMTGAYRVPRYNLYQAAEIQGSAAPGFSSGDAMATMERVAAATLPPGFSFQWTELSLQEKLAGNSGMLIFLASVALVFLLLAAQYESWTLPLAIVLIVPMCLLAAVTGLNIRGMPVDILAQAGFVVLIGLAAKNAILIVEFAKQNEEAGQSRAKAAIAAAKTRLRPILMTSLAFILGVLPLALATGAGAEMRQSLGTSVFYGMIGVTIFGLIFTPVFYVVCRSLSRAPKPAAAPHGAAPAPAE
ncbi:efflux RND transporter permease subunit [Methylopila turkensis]|uniref:Efflux pump membrane transporter n=1 Tax=Methylopila turkensis TaxID=1437816 RepID=A0A9W6N5M0_9HYPH|nr:multidrug efflux RND transporter permease subunit [Methylopila turkensis]GLK78372.1 multidrug efflux RND transporter permease subunit [Methylopila turkensis]